MHTTKVPYMYVHIYKHNPYELLQKVFVAPCLCFRQTLPLTLEDQLLLQKLSILLLFISALLQHSLVV